MNIFFQNIWLNYLVKRNEKLKKYSFNPNDISKVLIVELTRLGDVISTIPTIKNLKENLPVAQFSFAINEQYKPVSEELLSGINILGFNNTDTLPGLFKVKNSIQEEKFDLVICVSPSYRNAFVGLSAKGKFKIGYFSPGPTITPFLQKNKITGYGFTELESAQYHNENIYERSIKICNVLGYKTDSNINMAIRNKTDYHDTVVIHHSSGWKYRNWPLEKYFILAKKIINSTKYNIAFIGTGDENFQTDVMKNHQNRIAKIFSNDLNKIINTIKRSALFIGNDSGPLHLATALGIPSIGIFGPATPALTSPRSNNNYYFHEMAECCPCDQIKCIKPDNPCINFIEVEEVYNKAIKLLED